MILRNQTRSSIGGFGEVPDCRQRDQGSKKADNQNVQRVGVGVVFHVILHHHVENLITHSDSLCEISHTANRLIARDGRRHHMRKLMTAFTASARRSLQTGFGTTGAPGTTLWMRSTVSPSVCPVTKTTGTSHAFQIGRASWR